MAAAPAMGVPPHNSGEVVATAARGATADGRSAEDAPQKKPQTTQEVSTISEGLTAASSDPYARRSTTAYTSSSTTSTSQNYITRSTINSTPTRIVNINPPATHENQNQNVHHGRHHGQHEIISGTSRTSTSSSKYRDKSPLPLAIDYPRITASQGFSTPAKGGSGGVVGSSAGPPCVNQGNSSSKGGLAVIQPGTPRRLVAVVPPAAPIGSAINNSTAAQSSGNNSIINSVVSTVNNPPPTTPRGTGTASRGVVRTPPPPNVNNIAELRNSSSSSYHAAVTPVAPAARTCTGLDRGAPSSLVSALVSSAQQRSAAVSSPRTPRVLPPGENSGSQQLQLRASCAVSPRLAVHTACTPTKNTPVSKNINPGLARVQNVSAGKYFVPPERSCSGNNHESSQPQNSQPQRMSDFEAGTSARQMQSGNSDDAQRAYWEERRTRTPVKSRPTVSSAREVTASATNCNNIDSPPKQNFASNISEIQTPKDHPSSKYCKKEDSNHRVHKENINNIISQPPVTLLRRIQLREQQSRTAPCSFWVEDLASGDFRVHARTDTEVSRLFAYRDLTSNLLEEEEEEISTAAPADAEGVNKNIKLKEQGPCTGTTGRSTSSKNSGFLQASEACGRSAPGAEFVPPCTPRKQNGTCSTPAPVLGPPSGGAPESSSVRNLLDTGSFGSIYKVRLAPAAVAKWSADLAASGGSSGPSSGPSSSSFSQQQQHQQQQFSEKKLPQAFCLEEARRSGGVVALKECHTEGERGGMTRDMLETFERELRALEGLVKNNTSSTGGSSHPNLVQYVGFVVDASHLGVLLEFVDGFNLHVLTRRRFVFAKWIKLSYVDQLARALLHMHSCGLVHRDVKPLNVMVLGF